MRQQLLTIATLSASLTLAGCMRTQMRETAAAPTFPTVAVRFVATPEPEPVDPEGVGQDTPGVVDAAYGGFSESNDGTAPPPSTFHVALWGDGFQGADVTYGAIPMAPGTYNFAFFDRQHRSGMQGWLDVHATGSDILEVLYRWKSSIPKQARQLAYELELTGATNGNDPVVFETFTHQLAAFDQLERRINAAIAEELQARNARSEQVRDFMEDVEVLLIPGTDTFFSTTSEPAFGESELDDIRTGDGMTKILLVADHQNAWWKLHRVNELYNDLTRCKEVFREQVDRLERRKGLFLLTDHLHHHDKRFVDNEIHLQNALTALANLDNELNALRQRRTALAFVTGLFSPQDTFRALDQEEGNLRRELAVHQAEQRRINLLLDGVEESSVRRVVLERNYQRVLANLESVNRQLEDLNAARGALAAMTDSTNVLHRQGDTRLLTATFIGEDLPFAVRTAVEGEALMTVRLESDDRLSVPGPTELTATQEEVESTGSFGFGSSTETEPAAPTAVKASHGATEGTNRASGTSTTPSGTTPAASGVSKKGSASGSTEPTTPSTEPGPGRTAGSGTTDSRGGPAANRDDVPETGSGVQPAGGSGAGTDEDSALSPDENTSFGNETPAEPAEDNVDDSTRTVPDSAGDSAVEDGTAGQPTESDEATGEDDPSADAESSFDDFSWAEDSPDSAHLARYDESSRNFPGGGSAAGKEATADDCPLWVKLLVPPCWFAESIDRHARAPHRPEAARLAVLDEKGGRIADEPRQSNGNEDEGCPFLIRLLVPPCWFTN